MRSDRVTLLAACLLLLPALAGCAIQRTVLDDSAVDAFGTPEAELDFWDDVATRHVVTNSDALYGLFLLAGEGEGHATGAERIAAARARGWIRADETLELNESATVGLIAMAVCDILEIQGGVSMSLFGPSPRSCTREIVFRELLPLRTENQSLSGLEFVDLAGRVEDAQPVAPAPQEASS